MSLQSYIQTIIDNAERIAEWLFNSGTNVSTISKVIHLDGTEASPEEDTKFRTFWMDAIKEHRPFLFPLVEYKRHVPCRISELIEAGREQFNSFTKTVYVPDSKTGVPIHKPVPPSTLPYFLSIPPICPWLFYRIDKDGNYYKISYQSARKALKYCLKKAKLVDVQFKDTRHWAVTDLIEQGNSAHHVADIAGWVDTKMLKNYRHVNSLRSAQSIEFKPSADKPVVDGDLPDIAVNQ